MRFGIDRLLHLIYMACKVRFGRSWRRRTGPQWSRLEILGLDSEGPCRPSMVDRGCVVDGAARYPQLPEPTPKAQIGAQSERGHGAWGRTSRGGLQWRPAYG
jgi:hypothetical protein